MQMISEIVTMQCYPILARRRSKRSMARKRNAFRPRKMSSDPANSLDRKTRSHCVLFGAATRKTCKNAGPEVTNTRGIIPSREPTASIRRYLRLGREDGKRLRSIRGRRGQKRHGVVGAQGISSVNRAMGANGVRRIAAMLAVAGTLFRGYIQCGFEYVAIMGLISEDV